LGGGGRPKRKVKRKPPPCGKDKMGILRDLKPILKTSNTKKGRWEKTPTPVNGHQGNNYRKTVEEAG